MTGKQLRKKIFSPRWVKVSILYLIWAYLILMGKTVKYLVQGEERLEGFKKAGQPIILAFWHGGILLPLYYLRHRGINVLLSNHRSTSWMLQWIVRKFGFSLIKGSRGQGDARAVMQMVRKVKEAEDIVITPDGTSGPAQKLKPGLIYLAKKTGAPIIPFGVAAYPRKRLKTWDSFCLPHLFSKGSIIFGDPFWVEADLDKEAIEEKTRQLEEILNQLQDQAEQTAVARS